MLLAAGGAIAPLLYYLAGSLALAAYLCSSRSLLTRSIAKVKLRWHLFRDILRIGLMGSVSTVATNLSIGLAAAAFPHAWLSLFGADPAMLEAGTLYLRTVGPLYGFFGVGLVLYFASQGGGRLLWPVAGNIARLAVAAIGGWLAIRWGGGLAQVFHGAGGSAGGLRQRGCRRHRRRRLVRPRRLAVPHHQLAQAPTAGEHEPNLN